MNDKRPPINALYTSLEKNGEESRNNFPLYPLPLSNAYGDNIFDLFSIHLWVVTTKFKYYN